MPFFSIIVPVYNVEKYLAECVQSVLSQEFDDYEIILIDDGSTDKSGVCCDEYARKSDKIKVIHQSNKGLGGARNTGIKTAKGEWLLFLDSDDSLPEKALEKWFKEITITKDTSVFVARYAFQDEQGKVFTDNSVLKSEFIPGKCSTDNLQKAVTRYSDTASWAVWKLAVKRELIINNEIFFYEPIKYAEDLYWVFKLFTTATEICFVDICIYVYRVNRQGGLSTNNLRMLEGNLQTILQFEKEYGEQALTANQKFALAFLTNSFFYQVVRCTNLHKEQNEKLEQLVNKNRRISKYLDKSISSKKQILIVKAIKTFGFKLVSYGLETIGRKQ